MRLFTLITINILCICGILYHGIDIWQHVNNNSHYGIQYDFMLYCWILFFVGKFTKYDQ